MSKEFYGTPHIERFSKEDLLKESQALIPTLFGINQNGFGNDREHFQKILRLFEIIKYGRDKYPYILMLKFDDEEKLNEIDIWDDPRFSNEGGRQTVFSGGTKGIPSLLFYKEEIKHLKNIFNHFLSVQKEENLEGNVCIAGDEYCVLNIGKANSKFFENRKPVSVHRV